MKRRGFLAGALAAATAFLFSGFTPRAEAGEYEKWEKGLDPNILCLGVSLHYKRKKYHAVILVPKDKLNHEYVKTQFEGLAAAGIRTTANQKMIIDWEGYHFDR